MQLDHASYNLYVDVIYCVFEISIHGYEFICTIGNVLIQPWLSSNLQYTGKFMSTFANPTNLNK